MRLSLKIAWRNLFRHKGKSMIIGAILMLGAFLMTVGSGVISGMDRGLSENIVNLFDKLLNSNREEIIKKAENLIEDDYIDNLMPRVMQRLYL